MPLFQSLFPLHLQARLLYPQFTYAHHASIKITCEDLSFIVSLIKYISHVILRREDDYFDESLEMSFTDSFQVISFRVQYK